MLVSESGLTLGRRSIAKTTCRSVLGFPAVDRDTIVALAVFGLVVVATIVVYLPGLSGPLVLDDLPQLGRLIRQSAEPPGMLFRNYILSTAGPLGRPVAMATFIADAMTHGPDTWWWKYANLMLHVICGLLAGWLAALLVSALPRRIGVDPWLAGAAVAGLWLLHPLQVSTVLYTVQRMTVLSTLFTFAALVCYVRGRLVQDRAPAAGWLQIAVAFVIFLPLATLSKENGVLVPLYCTLIELLVLRFRGSGRVGTQMRVIHGVLGAGYVVVGIVLLADFAHVVTDSYAFRDFTPAGRVLTQFRILVAYLLMLVIPAQGRMGFFHDDVVPSTGLFDPVATFVSAILLVALLASAVFARKKLPLYAFGILFFFASHLVESSIIGLELAFEHRNHPGSFGIVLALVAIAGFAIRQRIALTATAVLVACGFSFLTWQRALTWSSPVSLYEFAYVVHPESQRLQLLFANMFASAGDVPMARRVLGKLGDGLGPGLHGLFFDCLEARRVSIADLDAVARIRDGVIDAHASSSAEALVSQALSGRCDVPHSALLRVLEHVLDSNARSARDRRSVMYAKAALLESVGRIDAAVATYRAAQDTAGDNALASHLAVRALIRSNRPDAALDLLQTTLRMEQTLRIRHVDMARAAFQEIGRRFAAGDRPERALGVYSDAIAAMPRDALFYLEKGRLLLRLGRNDEFVQLLDDVRDRKPRDFDEYEQAFLFLERALDRRRAGVPPA